MIFFSFLGFDDMALVIFLSAFEFSFSFLAALNTGLSTVFFLNYYSFFGFFEGFDICEILSFPLDFYRSVVNSDVY